MLDQGYRKLSVSTGRIQTSQKTKSATFFLLKILVLNINSKQRQYIIIHNTNTFLSSTFRLVKIFPPPQNLQLIHSRSIGLPTLRPPPQVAARAATSPQVAAAVAVFLVPLPTMFRVQPDQLTAAEVGFTPLASTTFPPRAKSTRQYTTPPRQVTTTQSICSCRYKSIRPTLQM